ncbi:unnamed protein product [Paramecium pentaurelia]|uniref:Uncharacterized protein n=1 Tax=Paramecium pentaurelia TaxID=43138 RepID=A0A8S1RYV9_9CILI|nr:unnamed protein product [Paramecium pentaurelia]
MELIQMLNYLDVTGNNQKLTICINWMVILVLWSVCFSLDGNTLASGSVDKSIRLWDVKTGQQKAKLNGHDDGVWSVCFSPDGNTLASGSSDNFIRLWDVKNKHCSDYRFKEIQVKNTRYPFQHPFAIHLILWFTQTSIFQGLREFYINNRFLLRELLEQIIISYNNT